MAGTIGSCKPFRSTTHQDHYEGILDICAERGDSMLQALPSDLGPLDFVYAPYTWSTAEKDAWKTRKEAPKLPLGHRCLPYSLYVFTNDERDPRGPYLSKADCERLENAPEKSMIVAMTADAARDVRASNVLNYIKPRSAVDLSALRMRGAAEEWPLKLLSGPTH